MWGWEGRPPAAPQQLTQAPFLMLPICPDHKVSSFGCVLPRTATSEGTLQLGFWTRGT